MEKILALKKGCPCKKIILENQLEICYNEEIVVDSESKIIQEALRQYKCLELLPIGKEKPAKKVEEDPLEEIDSMTKDELLDYSARNNIDTDYTMTKKEIKKIIRGNFKC